MAGSGHATHRNAIIILARYGGQRNCLVEKTTDRPESEVELLAPTPLIVAHTTVQFGGFTIGKTVMVRRIKLSTAVVVLHEITAKPQFIRKVTTELKAACPCSSRRGGIVKVPYTGKVWGVGHVHRITDTHAPGCTGSLVKDLYFLILNLIGGKGKIVNLLPTFKGTEHRSQSGFFITCKSHILNFRMLYDSHFTAVQTYLSRTSQADKRGTDTYIHLLPEFRVLCRYHIEGTATRTGNSQVPRRINA